MLCWAEDAEGRISNILPYTVVPTADIYGFDSALTLPASIRAIQAEAFAGSSAAGTVIIPPTCVSIGSRAFADSGICGVFILGRSITIADDAFDGSGVRIYCRPDNQALIDWCDAHGIEVEPLY